MAAPVDGNGFEAEIDRREMILRGTPGWRKIDAASSRSSQGGCRSTVNSFQASRATIACSTDGRFRFAAARSAISPAAHPRPSRDHRPVDPWPEPGHAVLPRRWPHSIGRASHRSWGIRHSAERQQHRRSPVPSSDRTVVGRKRPARRLRRNPPAGFWMLLASVSACVRSASPTSARASASLASRCVRTALNGALTHLASH